MVHRTLTRRAFIESGAVGAALAGATATSSESSTLHARSAGQRHIVRWTREDTPPELSPAARRAVNAALAYGDRYQDQDTGLIPVSYTHLTLPTN